jgi:hypothetical protein
MNAEAERVFEKMGLKCYASPEEIDKKFRRIMLKIHPDKSGRDSCKEAQEYNELRNTAKTIARDPNHHEHRERMKKLDETVRILERMRFLIRMTDILGEEIYKLECEHNPTECPYNPAEFEKKSRTWTPQQREEAEDAIQYGLQRNHLDKALAELETLQTENTRLRASLSPSIRQATQAIDAAEAKLAQETKRADGLIAAAAEGKQRADAEGERADAATKALEEETRRADAAEAELAQCKQRISELEEHLAAAVTSAEEKQRAASAEAEQRLAEVEQLLAVANNRATEWEHKSDARCEDIGALRMQLQGIREQHLQSQKTLKDADQRVEAAEAKAKEWETKCSALQESLDQILSQNVYSEAQAEKEHNDGKKRKHRRHFGTEEDEFAFKNKIATFIQAHIQESQTSFLSTNKIHTLYEERIGSTPKNQFFYKTLRNQIQGIFPRATLGEKSFPFGRERGYNGIKFI